MATKLIIIAGVEMTPESHPATYELGWHNPQRLQDQVESMVESERIASGGRKNFTARNALVILESDLQTDEHIKNRKK